MVDEACHWDEHTKPVNLVTRLCVQAYSLYRSCDRGQDQATQDSLNS